MERGFMGTSEDIFPELMIFCRVAEESYLALRRIKEGLNQKAEDKKALISIAIDFLKTARMAEETLRNPKFGRHALLANYAFKKASFAIAKVYKETKKEKILSILEEITIELDDIYNEESDLEEIDNLIAFFGLIREQCQNKGD